MTILQQGSIDEHSHPAALYTLLGCGALFALVTAVLLLRRRADGGPPEPRWKPLLSGVMSFGMLGVGAFGPAFLTDYGDFLTKLMQAQGDQQQQLYAEAVQKTASGELPDNVAQAAQAYMLQNPIPQMQQIVQAELSHASEQGRPQLEAFSAEIQRSEHTAQLAAEGLAARPAAGTSARDALGQLDTPTLRILEHNPALRPERLQVDPQVLSETLRARTARVRVP
jgi:hypothetical protein